MMDDTLSRMQRKLGERHPLTLSCAVNLANCHGDIGDPESAAVLERQTIGLLRKAIGPTTRTPWSARPTSPCPCVRQAGTTMPDSWGAQP